MKALLALLVCSGCCLASDVKLAWDPSINGPGIVVTNYVLYAHTNEIFSSNRGDAVVKVNAGTNLTALVEGLRPPGTWYFIATAMADGIESDPSNVVIIQVPNPPTNARVVVIEYGITLTNFVDTGFFRLRIPAP